MVVIELWEPMILTLILKIFNFNCKFLNYSISISNMYFCAGEHGDRGDKGLSGRGPRGLPGQQGLPGMNKHGGFHMASFSFFFPFANF